MFKSEDVPYYPQDPPQTNSQPLVFTNNGGGRGRGRGRGKATTYVPQKQQYNTYQQSAPTQQYNKQPYNNAYQQPAPTQQCIQNIVAPEQTQFQPKQYTKKEEEPQMMSNQLLPEDPKLAKEHKKELVGYTYISDPAQLKEKTYIKFLRPGKDDPVILKEGIITKIDPYHRYIKVTKDYNAYIGWIRRGFSGFKPVYNLGLGGLIIYTRDLKEGETLFTVPQAPTGGNTPNTKETMDLQKENKELREEVETLKKTLSEYHDKLLEYQAYISQKKARQKERRATKKMKRIN